MSAKRQEFIITILPGAETAYEEYGILPSLLISQAILESNWGKSHIENNLFGIKATNSWEGEVVYKNTKEYVDGKWITVEAPFRAYNDFSQSVEDYARLLAFSSRYKPVLAAEDYKQAAFAVWQSGYATDPNYPQKLIKIIEDYSLNKYDEEFEQIIEVKFKYFEDVPDGEWYTEAINRLYEEKLISGYEEDGRLLVKPNNSITRAEAFALIDKVLNYLKKNDDIIE